MIAILSDPGGCEFVLHCLSCCWSACLVIFFCLEFEDGFFKGGENVVN